MTYGQPEPQNPFGPPRQGPGLGQPGPYGSPQPNPYGMPQQSPNPYGMPQQSPYGPPQGQPNPYGPPQGQPNPYGQSQPNPYGQPPQAPPMPPRQAPQQSQPPQQTQQQPPQQSQLPQPSGGWSPVPAPPVPEAPAAEPTPRKAAFVATDIPVVTADTVPGRDIAGVVGPVIGVTTRSRDVKVGADTIALLTQARQDAIAALVTMAVDAGADAVVGLRFDGGKIAEALSEVTAYGTGVTLTTDEAPQRAVTDESQSDAEGTPGSEREGLDEQHIASPVPMDDPDPEDAFGSPVPHDDSSIHDQQLREQHQS